MSTTIARLRERWSDPLLTALTVLLAVMLFVIAPLQASGIFLFQAFEFFFAIILIVGVFVMSGSRIAAVAMLAALVMASTERSSGSGRHRFSISTCLPAPG